MSFKKHPNLCLDYLDDDCLPDDMCSEIHHDGTYLWQYKWNNQWQSVPPQQNDALETAYCDVNNDGLTINTNGFGHADFQGVNMVINFNNVVCELRRLSTPSDKLSSHNRATCYEWFFKDEKNTYIRYGETNSACQRRSATTTSSDDLELAYTSGKTYYDIASKKHNYRVDFNTMFQINQSTQVKRIVKRRPCVNKPPKSPSPPPKANGLFSSLQTRNINFQWFFKDEHSQWIKYGETGASNDRRFRSTTSSDDIEKHYSANLPNPPNLIIHSSRHTYILNFQEMIQTNQSTGVKRQIVRKAANNSPIRIIPSKPIYNNWRDKNPISWSSSDTSFPHYWTPIQNNSLTLVPLQTTDNDYQEVSKLLQMSINNLQIIKIERIQNPSLWKDFANRRQNWNEFYENSIPEEKYLFHGTDKKHIQAICKENLDWRYHGQSVGQIHGQGSYFARE